MVCRCSAVLQLFALLLLGNLCSTRPGFAQSLVQQNVDARVVLAFRVNPAALQPWLPAPWQVDSTRAGASAGANLTVTFIDRLFNEPGEVNVTSVGTTRLVALVVPVKNGQTGETALFDIREFNADPQGLPGPYKTGIQATVRRQIALQGSGVSPGTATESWEVQESGGGRIAFHMDYQRAIPSRAHSEVKLYSAVDPGFFRIYRADVGTDIVRSVPTNVDRLRSFHFRVSIRELSPLFDGTEHLVSIAVLPWYVRQVYLP
jgi:hypothetical protein